MATMIGEVMPTKTKTEFCGLALYVEHTPNKDEPDRWQFELYRGDVLLAMDDDGWGSGLSHAMERALSWASEAIPELITTGQLVLRLKSEVTG